MTTPHPTSLRRFPARVGIVINLDYLRDLIREFMSEVVTDDDNSIYAWPFEVFLQWAAKKQKKEMTNGKTNGFTQSA
jgi:hypothetical protein